MQLKDGQKKSLLSLEKESAKLIKLYDDNFEIVGWGKWMVVNVTVTRKGNQAKMMEKETYKIVELVMEQEKKKK